MTELVLEKEFSVHSYETDARGLVKATALLNYLQDSAGEHAGRLGLGVLDLLKRDMTWVLSRYHILIRHLPAMGARLVVTTWPSGKRGLFATRDFEVADGAGRPVLSATSSWMVLDLVRKKTLEVSSVVGPEYAVDRRALEDAFASLPVLSASDAELRFRVESGHIDWNRHVNNAVYVQWALEAVPADVLRSLHPFDLEVSYRAEAVYGDEVVSAVRKIDGGGPDPAFLHRITNAATGVELARLRTRWA
ncbi:MAG TPA: acyl-ACP thioesterase domain-containing protein [Acidobacteriota bacterium]|nr:acyl-ACP thioesterase domain-containing protein [Acidobacteriota bacterium]